MYEVLKNRGAMVLFASWFMSKIGDYFFLSTFPVWLLELTDSPVPGGIATAIDLVPVLLLGAVAGALVDRWNRYRTMVTADLVRAAAMVLAVVAIFLPLALGVSTIMVVLVVMSTASLFFSPSKDAMAIRLLRKDLVTPYTSLIQTLDNAMRIVVPLLALIIYGIMGPLPAFVIDAISFVMSGVLLMTLPAEGRVWKAEARAGSRSIWADIREGFTFIRERPTLKNTIILIMVMFAGAGATGPLQPYFVEKSLGLEPRMVGVLATAQGVGMIVGALFATATRKRILPKPRLAVGLLTLGLSIAFFGVTKTLVMASVATVLAGFSLALVLNGVTTILLSSVSETHIGRVGGLLGTGQVAVALVSSVVGPLLSVVVSLVVIYSAVGILVGVSGILAFLLLNKRAGADDADAAQSAAAAQ